MNAARFDFTGARVLVTGGSNGIGLAVARGFADAGASVTITGTRSKATDYEHDLSPLAYRQLDVRDAAALDQLPRHLDGLDVLVNNAGANFALRGEWDPAGFEESVRVNLLAVFRLTTACKPLLAASTLDGGASVLNVASMASFAAVTVIPGYGAAKAGIVQMTQNTAVAWAADGIRVNAVAPGLILTNMTAPMRSIEGADRAFLDRTPMRRWGEPADVVPAFLFLASAGARFVTGQTWCVDGGYTAA